MCRELTNADDACISRVEKVLEDKERESAVLACTVIG